MLQLIHVFSVRSVMIEIKLMGGLGNQMFIYAFARSLQLQGFDVVLDADFYQAHTKKIDEIFNNGKKNKIISTRKLGIDDFSIKIPIVNFSKNSSNKYNRFNVLFKIKRKLCFFFNKRRVINNDDTSVIELIKKKYCKQKKIILNGYFQNLLFFQKYQKEICADFSITSPLLPQNENMKKRILDDSGSCFIHVRRGDYLAEINSIFVKLDIEYYKQAIQIILSKVVNPIFYIFSNDISWCKDVLIPNLTKEIDQHLLFIFVENNTESNAIEEMELMRSCKNAIIANSSFSWWSAFLIESKSKVVVAPSRFIVGQDIKHKLIPTDDGIWITIEIKN